MNTNKMTRVAKNLDIFANVGGTITAAAGIVCLVVALLTLIFGSKMFAEGPITLDLDFIKFHLSENASINERFVRLYVVAATLGGSIICFLVWHISKLIRRILSPMKTGRPFEFGISENLRKVGWAILIGWLLTEVVGVISRILLINAYPLDNLFVSETIAKTELVFTCNLTFVMVACVVFFLSYVFTYGQVLQQESDETL